MILFKALGEALKRLPDHRLNIEVSEWDLRDMINSGGPDDVKILTTRSPDGALTIYRFMCQGDYEKWCEAQKQPSKPPVRKMYLE